MRSAKLAAEQRAKFSLRLNNTRRSDQKNRTQKSCVTAEKLEQGARNGEMKVGLALMICEAIRSANNYPGFSP